MIIRSLRMRLVLASLLWTVGLLGFTHVFFLFLARLVPGAIRVHLHSLLLFSLLFMLVGFLFVRSGVSRLTDLGARLKAIREGSEHRIEGTYPSEVQPLVTEVNALLDHREETVRRALAKAGDLAHGLKTPLAVIAHESDRLAAAGQPEPAAMIRQQIEKMQRQIDFHLAHARAAGSGATLGARSVVAESAEAITRTLQRLHAQSGIAFDVRVPREHAVRVQREDLDEMLGNLLDNATKFARTRVVIASTISEGRVVTTIDDDGPGLAPELRETVLQRGVRADEAAPGSGLGLAIVRDLAGLYGGSIALESSAMGGLTARLELPAANHD